MSGVEVTTVGVGINLAMTMRKRRMTTRLGYIRQINARRVQCPHCPLTIAPESMDRHVRINHSEDDDDD